MYTDNMRIEFNLVKPNDKDIHNIVDKPIILNENPIGVITNAELDESGLYYKCKGVIWDRYIGLEVFSDNYDLCSINLFTRK